MTHIYALGWLDIGVAIALLEVVAKNTNPPRGELDRLINRFDTLFAETVALRERITAMLQRQAIWPDRRRVFGPHVPERRRAASDPSN